MIYFDTCHIDMCFRYECVLALSYSYFEFYIGRHSVAIGVTTDEIGYFCASILRLISSLCTETFLGASVPIMI